MTKITIYKNHYSLGYTKRFGLEPADLYDEVEIELPEGVKEVELKSGSRALQTADGEVHREICTQHNKDGSVRPYLVVSRYHPKKLYLDKK